MLRRPRCHNSWSLESHGKSHFGKNQSSEDAGDEVDTVVVENHLAADRHHSVPGHLHDLAGLDVLAGELEGGADQGVQEGAKQPTKTSNQDDKKLAGGHLIK